MSLSIEVLTMWYNEAFLAPFFLKHYSWADKITLLYDEESTDSTLAIVREHPKVHIVPMRLPAMLDDDLTREWINGQYRKTQCDWLLCVDADEFAFYKEGDEFRYDLHPFLKNNPGYDIVHVSMYHTWRHANDTDLDPTRHPIPQRRHGDPDRSRGLNGFYTKPVLVRRGLPMAWVQGRHAIEFSSSWRKLGAKLLAKIGIKTVAYSPVSLLGAHWSMADPVIAERRITRRERNSANNLTKGYGFQHYSVTRESLLRECANHLHDPQIF